MVGPRRRGSVNKNVPPEAQVKSSIGTLFRFVGDLKLDLISIVPLLFSVPRSSIELHHFDSISFGSLAFFFLAFWRAFGAITCFFC